MQSHNLIILFDRYNINILILLIYIQKVKPMEFIPVFEIL